ncbi:MAG: hypothetical protein WD750_12820 [Gammaproteobacteria bacterium]
MNNDKNGSDNNEFPTIKPAELSLTTDAETAGAEQKSGAATIPTDRRVMIALLILITMFIGVIFFLPDWVDTTPVSSRDNGRPAAESDDDAPATGRTEKQPEASPAGTPWTDAQLSKLRKQSQDLLAEMLEAEETLKEHQVEKWAGEYFDKALQRATEGDSAYQERRFDEAVDLYRQALAQFNELLDSMEQVYGEAMEKGSRALAEGDAERAAAQFETALLIKPEDEAALRGQKRAGTLDEVNALIAEGDEALEEDRLEAARADYSRALEIDPHADKARQRLQETDGRIRDRDFRKAMSEGYSALDAGRLDAAQKAFTEAAKLKPGSGEAGNVLNQTRERITTRRINEYLESARRAASDEKWQTATEHYEQALSLDNSLAEAHSGLQRARIRFNLDQRLQQAIANPERLWDQGVREDARQLLREAGNIEPAGPKLSRQTADLERLLEKATTPIKVQLRSDNQTSVTVYKVGDMGKFEEKSITLMPGRYVAVGTRSGYRDVRVEFTLRPDEAPAPVVIEAGEKINLGSR